MQPKLLLILLLVLISIPLLSEKYSRISEGSNESAHCSPQNKDLDVHENFRMSAYCPHDTFVKKHHCPQCNNSEDALNFSIKYRVGYYKTNKNTVIFGDPTFTVQGNFCVSSPTKAFTCTINTRHCKHLGNECVSRHSTSNGHLFYRQIQCYDLF